MLQMFWSHVLSKTFQPFANELFKPTNNSNVKSQLIFECFNIVK